MNVKLVGISPRSFKSFMPHSHPLWEIVLNLEGEGITQIGDKQYSYHPGAIICQPPGIPHSKFSDQDFKDIYIQPKNFINPSKDEILIFNDDESKSVEALLFLALWVYQKKEANYTAIVDSLYETIYQLFLSWIDRKPQNPAIELFKNKLINNFTNPEFKISDIISETLYCSDHFRRCFKKDTGTTPIAYLINLRIEHAKYLLKQQLNTGMYISEIAYQSGFYDSHYFSRIFKSKTGLTPQEYISVIKNSI